MRGKFSGYDLKDNGACTGRLECLRVAQQSLPILATTLDAIAAKDIDRLGSQAKVIPAATSASTWGRTRWPPSIFTACAPPSFMKRMADSMAWLTDD